MSSPGPAATETELSVLRQRLAELEAENAALRAEGGSLAEAELAVVLEHTAQAVMVFATTGEVVHINRSARLMHGIPDDAEWTIQDFRERIILTDLAGRPLAPEHWPVRRALRGEVVRDEELRVVLRDAARTFIGLCSAGVVPDRLGQPHRVVVTFHDITERHRMEAALRESEDHYRHSIELSPQVPWTADASGRIDGFSQRWLELTGFTRERMLRGENGQIIHPDDRAATAAAWQHSVRTGAPYDIEHRICMAGGGYRWMRSRASARRDASGAIVRWYGHAEDIDDRKQAELALRLSEERWRVLNQAMPVMVWTALPDGLSNYSNEHWLRYTGQALEETYGLGWMNVVHPDDHPRLSEVWNRAVADGSQYEVEYRIRRASDGEYRWHLVRAWPLRDDTGTIKLWVGSSTDIHDLREADARLRASEEQLRRLTERFEIAAAASGALVYEWDLVAHRVVHLRGLEELTGYTTEETGGRAEWWAALLHPEDVPRCQAAGAALRAGNLVSSVAEYRIRHKNGEYRWVRDRAVVQRSPEGAVLRMVGSTVDITAERHTEEERENQQRWLRTVLDLLPVAVLFLEPSTARITFTNQAMARMLGGAIKPELDASGYGHVFEVYSPDGRRLTAEEMPGVRLARGEELHGEEIDFRTAQGHKTVIVTGRLLEALHGQPAAGISVVQDVTALKEAERALRRTNEELERFAYSISHDLQEPLRTVTAYAQLLVRRYRGRLDGDADEFLGRLVEGSARMREMIDALLAYSRSRGTGGVEPEPADCQAAAAKALANLETLISEAGAVVEVGPLPQVRGFPVQLAQLFQNLIANAVRYRREGVPAHVQVHAARQGTEWLFTVSDNGLGFEPRYAERLFQLFSRLHGYGRSGTGLGLAISRRIVEQHGGRIWAESPGNEQGASFYFTLPG